jgi:hypothetical protein
MKRHDSIQLGGSCGGVSNKTKFVLCLTVIDQEFQRKQVRFAGHMPLHTAIFRRADSSQKVKCAQNASFTDLYFIKAEFSAIFCWPTDMQPLAKIWKYF